MFFQLFVVFGGSELHLECLLGDDGRGVESERSANSTMCMTSLLLPLSTAFHLLVQVIYKQRLATGDGRGGA